MAESYSVKAILSATDSGFTSTLKSALGTTESLGSKIKSGFAFGVLTGAGQKAFSMLTSGCSNLIKEIDSSNVSWKTFTGNMQILGKSSSEIESVKKELQSFAEQTVYNSSDMASTFAQLEAVGTKNTTQLVKGFGGLAAAAENPKQAMKTLSQQATQMAAKPQVAWADFKLMLDQTPAGIAAVAKEMGMTTDELVANVQDGKIATDDFFDAITKVGTSDSFTKLATEYKSVGEAMDGLQETISNKLAPAFDILSGVAIGAIGKIADKVGEIDAEAIAAKVTEGLERAKPYWESFKEVAIQVGGAIQKLGGFLLDHADTISKAIPYVLGLVGAYKAFKVVNAVAPGMMKFASSITSLASKGISGIAAKLFGIAGAETATGKASKASSKQVLAAAKAFMMMGAAILMISAGFALLAFSAISLANAGGLAIGVMAGLVIAVGALMIGMTAMLKSISTSPGKLNAAATALLAMGAAVLLVAAGFAILTFSAISLANAGGPAIACMVGMVAVIALLAVGAAALGPALTAGAVGFIAFGAAILMVSVGALIAAAALAIVAAVLPTISSYGLQGAAAITALGASMMVFAAGALLAGVAAIILGAGLAVAAVGIAAAGVAVIILAAGMTLLAASTLIAGVGISLIAMSLPQIVEYGTSGAGALIALSVSMTVFGAAAAVAGAACIVLGAGLTVVAVSVALLGVALIVLGAGMLVFAAGTLLAAASLALLATQLPIITSYGMQGALSIAALGAGMLVFAAGAAVAGAACIVLGAGLTLVAVGLTLVGAAVLLTAAGVLLLSAGVLMLGASLMVVATGLMAVSSVLLVAAAGSLALTASFAALMAASVGLSAALLALSVALIALSAGAIAATVGVVAFGVAMIAGAVGVVAMAAALKAVNSSMKTIASNAKKAEKSLDSMQDSVDIVGSGLDALGGKAKSAMKKITSAFDDTASKAKTSGQKVGNGFTEGMQTGLVKAPVVASQMVGMVNAQLSSGYSGAYSAGAYISQGFAAGMLSCLGVIRSAAAQMAAAADEAVRAKAKIHSPSKVSEDSGEDYGQGWINGIMSKVKEAWAAAERLVQIPDVSTPNLAFAYSGEMSSEYDYYRNREYSFEIPVVVDGREVARATASYTQEELDRRQSRESRKHGML